MKYTYYGVSFVIMVIIGVFLNPMNILAYRYDDLYLSYTLLYGGLLMASNMMWSHELIHYITMKHFNIYVFCLGILISFSISISLLRDQLLVNDHQWLRRMIPHHSTALTTSYKIYDRTNNHEIKQLAKNIIETQEKEIKLMKSLLNR